MDQDTLPGSISLGKENGQSVHNSSKSMMLFDCQTFLKFLLNQAHDGHRPARTWFPRISLSTNVNMRVCVRPQVY